MHRPNGGPLDGPKLYVGLVVHETSGNFNIQLLGLYGLGLPDNNSSTLSN